MIQSAVAGSPADEQTRRVAASSASGALDALGVTATESTARNDDGEALTGIYGRIAESIDALIADPADATIRLQLAARLCRLGLGLPAVELLRGLSGSLTDDSAFADSIAIAASRSGRIAWSARAGQFRSNLRALQERGFDTQVIELAWREAYSRYELFADVLGTHHVRYEGADGRKQWIVGIVDHPAKAEFAELPEDIEALAPGPYLFEGLDLGWFFERMWRRTQNSYLTFSCALYVVEPDPAALAVVLHLHDWAELLRDERVMLFCGPACVESLRDTLTRHADYPIPKKAYHLSRHRPGPRANVIDTIYAVADQREQTADAGMARLEARYANRDAAYWARRYREALNGDGPPLRILAVVSMHTSFLQYSMRDAKAAAERMGHTFEIITESKPFEIIEASTRHGYIDRLDPDLFLVIDHIRPEFPGILPAGLPVMCWDQDALPGVFSAEKVAGISSLDTVVGLPKFECLGRFGCDARQFLAAPMATDVHRWDQFDTSETDLARYRCDLSFVSHASQTPAQFHAAERAACKHEDIGRLLDAIAPIAIERARRVDAICGPTLQGILAEGERVSGVNVIDRELRDRLIGWYIWRLCDRVFRHQALEWAAAWAAKRGRSLRIYGKGWEAHPTLAPFAAGSADNGFELLCIHRASRINVQLMPAGFFHQRALDGLASGGFFLTRRAFGDRPEPGVRALAEAIRRERLQSGQQVVAHASDATKQAFEQVRLRAGFRDDEIEEAFHHVRIYADWPYPSDVYPNIDAISFDDAASFEQLADRYIDDDGRRREHVEQLQAIIANRFSYDALLKQFMHFAANYHALRVNEAGQQSTGAMKQREAHASPEEVERCERNFYAEYVRPGMVVFDVGAFRGDMSMLFLEGVGRHGQVHAFEPCRASFERLQERFQGGDSSGAGKGMVLNCHAVTDSAGEATLQVYQPDRISWSTIAHRPIRPGGVDVPPTHVEHVPAITIDAYCEQHGIEQIDLLKLDVEGAEYRAMLGARRMFEQNRIACCTFELGQTTVDMGDAPSAIAAFLDSVGYETHNILPDAPVWSMCEDAADFPFSMYVARPKR